MAPRPSSSGISRSMVTTSGWYWWTLRTASKPSRAVATTRNGPSPSAPASTSRSTRRISALSSTTRTVGRRSEDDGIGAHEADLDLAVVEAEAHRAAAVPPHRLRDDRDRSDAQRTARGDHVALPHLDGARRHQRSEHAGAARQLGDEASRIGSQRAEPIDEQRHGGLGKL